MITEPAEPILSSPKIITNSEILLQGANRASEKVAVLHIAFLALCTYVLVTVFSTTDMDLLIGKSIKLPVVDVQVQITGFYTTVPYLVVLAHFNLLLQLQLLSRKLTVAFDAPVIDYFLALMSLAKPFGPSSNVRRRTRSWWSLS